MAIAGRVRFRTSPPEPRRATRQRDEGTREDTTGTYSPGVPGPRLETGDGVELATRRWPVSERARAVVVLAHGLTANKDDARVVALASELHRQGFEVIAYDSRGHGQSGGQCTLGDLERHDVAAVVAWARTRNRSVILVGVSMGAVGVLSYAATANDLTGVVTVSSPGEWRLPLRIRSMITVSLARTRTGREFARRRMGVRIAPWTSPESPRRSSSGSPFPWPWSTAGATPSFLMGPGWPGWSTRVRVWSVALVHHGPRLRSRWTRADRRRDHVGVAPERIPRRASRRRRMPRHRLPSSSDRARELAGREHRPQGAPTTGRRQGGGDSELIVPLQERPNRRGRSTLDWSGWRSGLPRRIRGSPRSPPRLPAEPM